MFASLVVAGLALLNAHALVAERAVVAAVKVFALGTDGRAELPKPSQKVKLVRASRTHGLRPAGTGLRAAR